MVITQFKSFASGQEEEALASAAEVIMAGGVIVYPTDTIYGIGADATNAAAIERIFAVKERDRGKAMLVLAGSLEMASRYTKEVTPEMRDLLSQYWPGSVTFILRANSLLPKELMGGADTIGIRVPKNALCRALCQSTGVPIVSTSANLSGASGGVELQQVIGDFTGKVDLIIENGNAPLSSPSTVVDLSGETPRVLRRGAVLFKNGGVI
jgi:L-threonylcarbamoyladenylate synthase